MFSILVTPPLIFLVSLTFKPNVKTLKRGEDIACVPTAPVTIDIFRNGKCCFDIGSASDAWLFSDRKIMFGMRRGAAVPKEET